MYADYLYVYYIIYTRAFTQEYRTLTCICYVKAHIYIYRNTLP